MPLMKCLSTNRGFTLIEVILVTAIVVLFVSSGIPLYTNFFEKNQLGETAEQLSSVLKIAREKSIARDGNFSYGIYFNNVSSPHKYIYFKGDGYLSRDTSFDRTFLLSGEIKFEQVPAASEIVFAKGSGGPSATSTIIIKNNNEQRKIEVEKYGQIYINYGS